MFEPASRYTKCENITTTADGHIITYKKRRFLPQAEKMIILQEVVVIAGDRLDTIATRIIGDPEQYWRICDANNTMDPFELTAKPGRVLQIATPWK